MLEILLSVHSRTSHSNPWCTAPIRLAHICRAKHGIPISTPVFTIFHIHTYHRTVFYTYSILCIPSSPLTFLNLNRQWWYSGYDFSYRRRSAGSSPRWYTRSWGSIVVSRLTWAFIPDCRVVDFGTRPTKAAEHQSSNWGMQMNDGCSLELCV